MNLANRFQVYISNGGVSVFTEEDDQSSYLEGIQMLIRVMV